MIKDVFLKKTIFIDVLHQWQNWPGSIRNINIFSFPVHTKQLSTLHYIILLDIIYHYQPRTVVRTNIHTLFYESLKMYEGTYPPLQ